MAQRDIDFAVRKDQSTSLDNNQPWLWVKCCMKLFVNAKSDLSRQPFMCVEFFRLYMGKDRGHHLER